MFDYGDSERPDVFDRLPIVHSYLDVGCSTGALGVALKRRDTSCVVWGIEPKESVAAVAASRLDRVLVGTYPDPVITELGRTTFDCVMFLDTLEHMADPWSALRSTAGLLTEGGVVIASIPNVRNVRVLAQLARGRWDYAESGILDRTHLRFFTRATMVDLFEDSGFRVDAIEPINLIRGGKLARAMEFAGKRSVEFRATQFLVAASRQP